MALLSNLRWILLLAAALAQGAGLPLRARLKLSPSFPRFPRSFPKCAQRPTGFRIHSTLSTDSSHIRRDVIMKYWATRSKGDVEQELNRMGISIEKKMSSEEKLSVLVDEITRLAQKYSGMENAKDLADEMEKKPKPDWRDAILQSRENKDWKRDPRLRGVSGKMDEEELARRVMGGARSEVDDLLERGPRGDRGFSGRGAAAWLESDDEADGQLRI